MQRLVTSGVLLFLLLTSCVSVLEHIPGPESPELLEQSSGTILLSAANASGSNDGVLVDLPTLRRREFELERDPLAISGPNDRGELVYSYENKEAFVPGFTRAVLSGFNDVGSQDAPSGGLRVHDVATGVEREVLALPHLLVLVAAAPAGPLAILGYRAPTKPASSPGAKTGVLFRTLVLLHDLDTGAQREVEHGLGWVSECHWLPDGRSFALSGKEGGARFDAATLACIGRNADGYGPFTPDGASYCVNRERQCLLVRIEGDHEVATEALLPGGYPRVLPGAVFTQPIGMCGPRLCVYLAHPTEGQKRHWSGHEGGYLVTEAPAVKIASADGRSFVTALEENAGATPPLFSPCRLAEFRR